MRGSWLLVALSCVPSGIGSPNCIVRGGQVPVTACTFIFYTLYSRLCILENTGITISLSVT